MIKYFQSLVGLTAEMAPWLLLGFLIAGLLKEFVKPARIHRHLGKSNLKSVIYGALWGVPLPLCSCGVIPTGVSLRKNGASDGATVSFLISTPQTGVDSIAVTWSMLGWPFAVIRPLIAFITGVAGGRLVNTFGPGKNQKIAVAPMNENPGTRQPLGRRLRSMLHYSFVEFLDDIVKWLVIGLLIAALIDVLIPAEFFTRYLTNPWLEMAVMLALSIPLYVCATGSVPLAAVLLMKGLSPGAAFVFLMAGPATNAATISVLGNTLGKRVLSLYLLSIVAGALLFGGLINLGFPADYYSRFLASATAATHHSTTLPWWKSLAALVLAMLLLAGLLRKYILEPKSNNPKNMEKQYDYILKVEGMTCHHCEANVAKNLLSVEGVEEAQANLNDKKVYIKGNILNMEEAARVINSLGYHFIGLEN